MKTGFTKILYLTTSLVLLACHTPNNISFNENTAQLLLGQDTAVTKEVFRDAPVKITGTKESASGFWYYKRDYEKQHYVPSRSYTSSSYNPYTDTQHITTTYTPGYTYTTQDFMAYMVEIFSSNYRITGVDFTARQMTFATNDWCDKNRYLITWNRSNANDQLEPLMRVIAQNPSLNTPEMLLKGCLQAAKYDSLDVLVYYLVERKVPLDVQAETWVRGTGDLKSLNESGCFILGTASVREIIMSRNNEKVIKKLKKLGVL